MRLFTINGMSLLMTFIIFSYALLLFSKLAEFVHCNYTFEIIFSRS